jgi:hypothetical protein
MKLTERPDCRRIGKLGGVQIEWWGTEFAWLVPFTIRGLYPGYRML